MRIVLVVVAALALACGYGPGPNGPTSPSLVPSETTSPESPATLPAGTVAAPAPASGIAYFAPAGDRCGWYLMDPQTLSATPRLLFPKACARDVELAPEPGTADVLVWFHGGDLWRVDPTQKRLDELPIPRDGRLAAVGWGKDGVPRAYTLGGGSVDDLQDPKVLRYDGVDYPVTTVDGEPELAHAWAFRGREWTVIETKPTTTGWDYAEEQRVLDAWKDRADASPLVGWSEVAGDGKLVTQVPEDLAATLRTAAGPELTDPPDQGEWHVLELPAGRVAWWMTSIEFLVTTDFVLVEQGGAWKPLWTEHDTRTGGVLGFQARGDQLLVVKDYGAAPRLYQVPSGQLLWSQPEAVGATFWPVPAPIAP